MDDFSVSSGDLSPAHGVTVVVGGVEHPSVGGEGVRDYRPDVLSKAAHAFGQPPRRAEIIDNLQTTHGNHVIYRKAPGTRSHVLRFKKFESDPIPLAECRRRVSSGCGRQALASVGVTGCTGKARRAMGFLDRHLIDQGSTLTSYRTRMRNWVPERVRVDQPSCPVLIACPR